MIKYGNNIMITLKISEKDYKLLKAALCYGEEWDDSLIDAHKIGLEYRDSDIVRTIPVEFNSYIRTLKNEINGFRKLKHKLYKQVIAQKNKDKNST